MATKKPFSEIVKSPWTASFKEPSRCFKPTSTIYDDGLFFVSKLFDKSYLFFIKIGNGFYAFNQLAGFKKEYIEKIKQALEDGDTKGDFLVNSAIETIQDWERRLSTQATIRFQT